VRLGVAAVLLLLVLPACGGGTHHQVTPEQALRAGIGVLQSPRINCNGNVCTVIVTSPLHSNYEGFLLAMPVFDHATSDPNLAGVSRITLTMNDDKSGQVFSITCATKDLTRPLSTDALRAKCHSIYL
jgi:hypothetical protein